MPSRAAVMRELLWRGFAAEGFNFAGKGVRSQEFGVVGKSDGYGSSPFEEA
jgi:hypothetical protein